MLSCTFKKKMLESNINGWKRTGSEKSFSIFLSIKNEYNANLISFDTNTYQNI